MTALSGYSINHCVAKCIIQIRWGNSIPARTKRIPKDFAISYQSKGRVPSYSKIDFQRKESLITFLIPIKRKMKSFSQNLFTIGGESPYWTAVFSTARWRPGGKRGPPTNHGEGNLYYAKRSALAFLRELPPIAFVANRPTNRAAQW